MSSSTPPALAIGAILGDSNAENMAWSRAINAVSRQVQELRVGVESPLRLNVIYHVDGKMVPNEFNGVRTSSFSKKTAHLAVQAAVPLEPIADRNGFLLDLLRRAVDEAEKVAAAKGISDHGLPEIRRLVDQLSP